MSTPLVSLDAIMTGRRQWQDVQGTASYLESPQHTAPVTLVMGPRRAPHPQIHTEALTLNMTVFGDRAFEEVSKGKRGYTSGPKSSRTGAPVRDRRRDTHREKTRQEVAKVRAEKRGLRETQPCWPLELPERGEQTPVV